MSVLWPVSVGKDLVPWSEQPGHQGTLSSPANSLGLVENLFSDVCTVPWRWVQLTCWADVLFRKDGFQVTEIRSNAITGIMGSGPFSHVLLMSEKKYPSSWHQLFSALQTPTRYSTALEPSVWLEWYTSLAVGHLWQLVHLPHKQSGQGVSQSKVWVWRGWHFPSRGSQTLKSSLRLTTPKVVWTSPFRWFYGKSPSSTKDVTLV